MYSPGIHPPGISLRVGDLTDAPLPLQDLMRAQPMLEKDKSGNPILADIGHFLCKALKHHFSNLGDPVDLKFIDPTYMVRAIPTISSDRIYCKILGQSSVHAAFAGFTGTAPCNSCWPGAPWRLFVPLLALRDQAGSAY